jgi:hypothetical protein
LQLFTSLFTAVTKKKIDLFKHFYLILDNVPLRSSANFGSPVYNILILDCHQQ